MSKIDYSLSKNIEEVKFINIRIISSILTN